VGSVERVAFIVNQASGVGHEAALASQLAAKLQAGLPAGASLNLECVSDHSAARSAAASFLRAGDAAALMVVGGGGGTLRGVIEGVCEGCPPGGWSGCVTART
jgi:diacylglycerol kinase family enzyme